MVTPLISSTAPIFSYITLHFQFPAAALGVIIGIQVFILSLFIFISRLLPLLQQAYTASGGQFSAFVYCSLGMLVLFAVARLHLFPHQVKVGRVRS
jgi:hypothetical protein